LQEKNLRYRNEKIQGSGMGIETTAISDADMGLLEGR